MNKIRKRLDNIWNNKWVLRLFAVLFAICLWFYVSINFGSSESMVIPDVPIRIDLSEATSRDGLQLINVVGPEDLKDKNVDVIIKGKKLAINQISKEDIVVTAYASHITTAGTHVLNLKYECTNPLFDISFAPENISEFSVFVDRISEKNFETVNVTIDGNVVTQEGFVAENPYSSVTTINLKGPESIINTIETVTVKAKLDEVLKETVIIDGSLVFLNSEGEVVESSYITHNFTDRVTVTVPVKMTKKLKLEVKFKNVPEAYSKEMLSYKISPSEITVKGSHDAITAAFDEESDTFVIGEVDFTKLTKDSNPMTFPINLSSGIDLTEELSEVTVKFDLYYISSKTVDLNKDNVKFNIINNSENHNVEIVNATLKNVKVYGPSAQLRWLEDSDFLVVVDLFERDAFVGNCIVNAVITVSGRDKCWVVGTYEVEVAISSK